jgi:hypothetical protein
LDADCFLIIGSFVSIFFCYQPWNAYCGQYRSLWLIHLFSVTVYTFLPRVRLISLSHRCRQALLSAPNPDDPLANDVASHWKSNEAQAITTGLPVVICVVASLSLLIDVSLSWPPEPSCCVSSILSSFDMSQCRSAQTWTKKFAV